MTDLQIDQQALADLHEEAWPWALHLTGGDREFAQDILQTAYLKILDGKARWSGRSSFKTWVFGVVRMTCKASQRKRSLFAFRHTSASLEELDAIAPISLPTDPISASMEHAVATLPAKQGQVVALVFGQDFTIEEAAAVMNVSVGTARTHYSRAKAALRAKLSPKQAEHTHVG